MADRPPYTGPGAGPDGDPDGGPKYTWLYGDPSGDSSGDFESSERTRMMPVQPRPASGASRPAPQATRQPAPRPAARPIARTPAPAPAQTVRTVRSRRRWFRPRLRWILLLVLAYVAYVVIVPFYAWHQVNAVAWEPKGARPGEQPGTTYLMVGSDSRAGLTRKQRRELGTGNAAGQRTDTILMLHTGSGPNLLMSIPRDSSVDIPGYGENKINAAFAFGGPQLLVKTVEQDTGIRVDDYVEIGLGGLAGVVDAVGGIQICPTERMVDPLANLNIKKGCQQADGGTALGYARSRHTQQLGDLDRARHQREVVSAVGKKVVSPWTVLNPFRYWNLLTSVPDFFAFGQGTSTLRAGQWASAMTHVNGENGLTCGTPISDLFVHWDPDRSKQMFDYIKNDKTADIPASLCTPSGLPKSVTG